ncbi:MAG: hypothetical protein A2622_12090 [Bdellovibrionales bacterium RIFCSPHIGHO2_01_FULL_40_29]|nr:MAG: hypothetical protein A2622_12090 [Bdellovibrionales bacterium RIFCSPHIGHO2_01_FULL_40_29]OFZ35597.1 MAG: hypothetical protein A3D17_00450 [Bdellovibrionales bacterium RIFCSPHIGHO2_02_FULL_40_15]
MVKWFLQFQGQIQGPFTDDALETVLGNLGEMNMENTLVWKRGLTEWIKSTKWQTEAAIPQEITMEHTTAKSVMPSSPAKTSESSNPTPDENTFAQTFTDTALYRVQLSFVDQPLMTKTELLAFISKQKNISAISIQNPKTKEWTDVYAYPDIIERLGLSRRKHPRVPILANFTGSSDKGGQLHVKVVTISEGGMGFTEVLDLKIGDTVEGQISSPHFFQPLHVTAEVIYSGIDGYIGLKFLQINDEAKAAIIDYVKKFGKHET